MNFVGKLGIVVHICIISTQQGQAEESEFMAILGYNENLRLATSTVSKWIDGWINPCLPESIKINFFLFLFIYV